jgi:hypothetical protein
MSGWTAGTWTLVDIFEGLEGRNIPSCSFPYSFAASMSSPLDETAEEEQSPVMLRRSRLFSGASPKPQTAKAKNSTDCVLKLPPDSITTSLCSLLTEQIAHHLMFMRGQIPMLYSQLEKRLAKMGEEEVKAGEGRKAVEVGSNELLVCLLGWIVNFGTRSGDLWVGLERFVG